MYARVDLGLLLDSICTIDNQCKIPTTPTSDVKLYHSEGDPDWIREAAVREGDAELQQHVQ